MLKINTQTANLENEANVERGLITLHVCTSCRPQGHPREPRENRPGFTLYKELTTKISDSPLNTKVKVSAARCLSLCPRPCGIAFSSQGGWSYLFGDQKPGVTASDVIKCLETYIENPNGDLPRGRRPRALQASILGRIPPNLA